MIVEKIAAEHINILNLESIISS